MLIHHRSYLLLLLLFLTGCGLADYESRMDAQRARLKVLDEENKLLGEAVDRPHYKINEQEESFWPFDVYLRLPREVSGAVQENSQFMFENLSLFRYAGHGNREGVNFFLAAALVAEINREHKYPPGEWPPGHFRAYVREALRDYYRKQYKVNYEFPPFTKFTREKKIPLDEQGRELPPLDLDVLTFTDEANKATKDHSEFRAYFHQKEGKQVAVIVQLPLAQATDAALQNALEWSLKSLDITADASGKRQRLQQRKTIR